MLSLKTALSKKSVCAWEILRTCHVSAFIFLVLSCIAACESSNLISANTSHTSIFSPLQSVFLPSTPYLSGVAPGQTLLSSQGQTSLETAINSVNDGFITKFGVQTGISVEATRTAEVSTSSGFKMTNVQHMETIPRSQIVGETLQSENRNAKSIREGGEIHNLSTVQFTNHWSKTASILSTKAVETSHMQHDSGSRTAREMISTFDKREIMNTKTPSWFSDFTSAGTAIVSITPSFLLQSSYKQPLNLSGFSRASEPASVSSAILRPHEKFTPSVSTLTSNLHEPSSLLSRNDLSPGKNRSKSTLLSHYSSGPITQAHNASSVSTALRLQQTSRLSPSSSRPAVAKESSSITSVTAIQDSSSFSTTAIPKVSTSFTRSIAKSYTKLISTSRHVKLMNTPSSSERLLYSIRTTSINSLPVATHISSVQPSLIVSSLVVVQEKAPLTCKINNITCVCFNCEQAREKGKICCTDLIDNKKTQQGVHLNMINITVESFYQKVLVVSEIIAEVIWDSCKTNSSLCLGKEKFSEAKRVRKRRSPQNTLLNENSLSDSVRVKRDSEYQDRHSQTLTSSVNKGALHPDIKPSKTNITRVHVTIFSIYSKAGHPSTVGTAFYVTVTSFSNGTNQTQVVDGKGLLQILRDKKHVLENKLNLTIDSFSAGQSSESATTGLTPSSTLVPNPSPGSQNWQTPLATPEGRSIGNAIKYLKVLT